MRMGRPPDTAAWNVADFANGTFQAIAAKWYWS